MTEPGASAAQFSPRTVWARRLETPLRRFLRTETGSAAVLLAATLAALAWANIDPSGYAATWHTVLMIRSGTRGLADSWQGWVNSGLMAFFFLVAGLEARREFDLGELRERRRVALPLVVALGGMVVPIAIYLAINFGRSSVSGWGTAMSTDTAFALGALALVGPGVPDRVRTYLLTFALADDVAGIVVIALAYSGHIDLTALAAGVAILGAVMVARWRGVRNGPAYLLLGVAAWVAFFESGVDPVVVGLAMGLLVAGIGFIVSLLIASLAFHGSQLAEAKVGVLSAALCASALSWVVFRLTAMLPKRLRARALLGTADTIIDLAVPVDADRDHVRGPDRAPVTLVEYGDFECPHCGRAEPVVRELLAGYGDLRYVWRHLPLTDVHPHAQLAAEGAEAAAGEGKFWPMHDQLLDHQGALTGTDLIRYAGELGLDIDRFTRDLANHAGQAKIAADVDSADLSGVSGTPTFFINGKRHQGAYDISTLSDAVRTARTRTLISSPRQPRRAS